METEIAVLLELFAQFGFSSVFLWLFVRYREDIRDRIRQAENETIRCGSQPHTEHQNTVEAIVMREKQHNTPLTSENRCEQFLPIA
jgi:hypothetical protein